MRQRSRTVSEEKFEEYLRLRGIPFEHEPSIAGSSRAPDYLLRDREAFLVEVKEFVGKSEDAKSGFGAFDAYAPIRKKIEAARKKFQNLKNYPCGLLLYNVSGHLIRIDRPEVVMGAMLGDLGFKFRVDPEKGSAIEEPKPAFLRRGKMINYASKQPWNQTIGAILVLEEFNLGIKRYLSEERRLEAEKGRSLKDEELAPLRETVGEAALRVKLHENPYARKRFPREAFRGSFDEHWSWSEDGRLERGFVGSALLALEAADES